jgi:hypothetical protein
MRLSAPLKLSTRWATGHACPLWRLPEPSGKLTRGSRSRYLIRIATYSPRSEVGKWASHRGAVSRTPNARGKAMCRLVKGGSLPLCARLIQATSPPAAHRRSKNGRAATHRSKHTSMSHGPPGCRPLPEYSGPHRSEDRLSGEFVTFQVDRKRIKKTSPYRDRSRIACARAKIGCSDTLAISRGRSRATAHLRGPMHPVNVRPPSKITSIPGPAGKPRA